MRSRIISTHHTKKNSRSNSDKRNLRSKKLGIETLEQRALLSIGAVQNFLPTQHDLLDYNGYLTAPSTGTPLEIATSYLKSNAATLGLTPNDFDHTIITNQYTDSNSGITHLYLRQEYNGLEVHNANLVVNITAAGQIINVGGGFVPGLNGGTSNASQAAALANSGTFIGPTLTFAYLATSPSLTPVAALEAAAPVLGLSSTVFTTVDYNVESQSATLKNAGFSLDDIPAQLQYVPTSNGQVTLTWDYVLRTPDGDHWYDVRVDTLNGQIVDLNDWVSHATYNVYPRPVENPDDGSRSIVTDPADPAASPFGWQDTNGVAGPEYTITRGNNVYAYEDTSASDTPGHSPDGGASLNFNYPLNLNQEPINYQDAAITNLFYWNNVIHDIHYKYGFTEAAGNFQEMNYTDQGLGGDKVLAEAQDGEGTDNANFATPPDGLSGRMQMFLYTATTPGRDGDLDNAIITHEYGHGVSNRLVGGPANADALWAIQSGGMGEGWSDWWGLMFTEKAILNRTMSKTVGNYVEGLPPDGAGIRRYPYSFDMSIDPLTYGTIQTDPYPEVHNFGEVWCSALWDMTVLLEEKYGFDPDIAKGYSPDCAGNIVAMQLVMDSLKLMQASPSFLNGRDAILQADQVLTGGANALEIWTAFARRGMGLSANDGGDGDSTNVTEAFDMPVMNPDLSITKKHVGNFKPGDVGDTYTITVSNVGKGTATGVVTVIDALPAGLTATDMSGSGWIVDLENMTASREDSLRAGKSYPPLIITVNVALDAPSSVVNTVTVYQDGETNLDNNTANDSTTIGLLQIADVSPTLTGGTLDAGTPAIKIHFNSNTIGANDPSKYRLQSIGPDGLLGTSDDELVPFTLSYQATDPIDPLDFTKANIATLTFSSLPENLYRLTVEDSITDTGGVRLDGDGDNRVGGNMVADFVAVPSSEVLSKPLTFSSGGSNPTSVTTGDFNVDGKKDLAVINNPFNGFDPSIKIFLGDGKGGFNAGIAITTGLSKPYAVVAGDFTGDQKDDLAVANYGNNTVEIFRGDGRGGFVLATTVNVGTHPINLVAGDFNADGKKDIAVANYGDTIATPAIPGTLGILKGTGNGAFTYSSIGIGSTNKEPRALVVADFNGDSKPDIAMTNYYNNNVVIYKGNGNGGFTIQTTKSTNGIGPRSIAAGDFNGDGKADLVIGNYITNNVSVLMGDGTGNLSNATLFYSGSDLVAPLENTNPRGVAVDDFNGDRIADIIVANSSNSNVGVLLGNGSGSFATALTFNTDASHGTYGLAVADFNGDRRPDVAVTNTGATASNNSVSIFCDFYGTPVVTLHSPQYNAFDISIGNFGQGQFIQGTDNAFDGFGRLSVGGTPFQMTLPGYTIPSSGADSGQTLITNTGLAAGLNINRKITVPNTGTDDFARTVDIFANPTNTDITTTVQIVGNLGSDAATSIFATSSGDTTLTTSDLWFATRGGKGQTLLHYVHGYAGLEPTSVELVGDNVIWTYVLTVPALQTKELAYFTILLDDNNPTQAAAAAKANAMVTPGGFLGKAGLGLSPTEKFYNFFIDTQPMTILPADWALAGSAGLTLKRTAGGWVHLYRTGTETDIVTPRLYSSISSLSITGRDNDEDELTIDLTGGNPTPAGGASFNGGTGGGNALLLVTGTSDDSVTMTATQISDNSLVLVNYSNTAHFGFILGGLDSTNGSGGVNSETNNLLLNNVILNLDRDNAISDGTNVTVNGGVLNFNGHAASIGDLIVTGGAQVDVTSIKNWTTTVTSGTLTVASIYTDTLTIGPVAPIVISPDAYEDNDSKAIVDGRPEGGTNSPNLGSITSEQIISDLTMEDGGDWYKFRMDAPNFVRIDFTNSQGNLDMVVYGADGTTVLGSSAGTGDSETVSLNGMTAGYFYVKVNGYQGATNLNYSLTIAPFSPDAYEENDDKTIVDARTEGEANSPNLGLISSSGRIISGLTMEDSADWYRFRMGATGTAADVVRIDFLNSQGNLNMVVYRADGTTVAGSSSDTGDSEIVNLNGLPTGYYYVKVFGNQGATNPNYTLSIAPISPDRYEDNDSKAIVDARLEGATNSPNLGLISMKQIITGLTMEDGGDWYKFRMDTAGNAAGYVQIDFANSIGNLDMVVYGLDGTTVVGSSTGTGNSELVSMNGQPAGYYYVKVYGNQAATNPNYTLTFFPLSQDRYEENDSKTIVDGRTEGATNSPNLGTITAEKIITGLSVEDSADWYKFKLDTTVNPGGFVRIDFAQSQGDLDLVLYGTNGTTVLGASMGKGDSEIISLNGLSAGVYYYVKVIGYLGFNPDYTLSILPFGSDLYEDNDSSVIVDGRTEGDWNSPNLGSTDEEKIIAGLTMDDGADWYKFKLDMTRSSTTGLVKIDFTNSKGDLDVDVYLADGTTLLATSNGTGDGELVSLDGVLAGYYYVKVYGHQGATNPNYTLSILPILSDLYEENDTKDTSSTLGLISQETTITDLTMDDDGDWFKFDLGAKGLGTDYVYIDSGSLSLVVYKSNGTTILGSGTSFHGGQRVSLKDAPAGTYYVKVSGERTANYTLQILPILPDRYEYNDTSDYSSDLGKIVDTTTMPFKDLTMSDSADWYKFSLAATGVQDVDYVQIDFKTAQGDLDMILYSTTAQIGISNGYGDSEKISLGNVAAGDYYLKVYGWRGATNPNYSLTIKAPKAAGASAASSASPMLSSAPSDLAGSFEPGIATLTSLHTPSIAVAPDVLTVSDVSYAAASKGIDSAAISSEAKWNSAATTIAASSATKVAAKAARLFDPENSDLFLGDLGLDSLISSRKPVSQNKLHDAVFIDMDSWERNI